MEPLSLPLGLPLRPGGSSQVVHQGHQDLRQVHIQHLPRESQEAQEESKVLRRASRRIHISKYTLYYQVVMQCNKGLIWPGAVLITNTHVLVDIGN